MENSTGIKIPGFIADEVKIKVSAGMDFVLHVVSRVSRRS